MRLRVSKRSAGKKSSRGRVAVSQRKKAVRKQRIPKPVDHPSTENLVPLPAPPVSNKVGDVVLLGLGALEALEKHWPSAQTLEVKQAFEKLREAFRQIPMGEALTALPSTWPSNDAGPRHFDVLDLIRHVFKAHDLLFLSRQVSYHIATTSDLPKAWADADQIQFVFSQIIEHLVRRAARASRVSIALAPFTLRSGQGIGISFSSIDRNLRDIDRQVFLTELFQGHIDAISGISLSDCRQVIVRQRGQLWVDFQKSNRPAYHLVLPISPETAALSPTAQQTFKYDIAISNYADVRKRFGIRKSQSLVMQIEHYVRSLVRYPIDVVMALGDKGIITTIYETQRGTAQSVASRISQRLGTETFRIGKRPVDIAFSYHLSPLSVPPTKIGGASARHQH